MKDVISTGLGKFSKEKFGALLLVRNSALRSLREKLCSKGFVEVTTSSLVNIAGSCENPHASFSLNFYGREAHLSQSAQLQLESLVIRLKKSVFTVNNSFREENFDDPEAEGRRLSEFTLIEPEKPLFNLNAKEGLNEIIKDIEDVIKFTTRKVLEECSKEIELLGGDVKFLSKVVNSGFNIISYDGAIELLNSKGFSLKFGDDLGIKEEREILKHFNNIPCFVINFPASIKFFNMKRSLDGSRVFSVDLLLPKLGECVGGAVREEDGEKIKKQFLDSKIAKFLVSKNLDPLEPFNEYFNLFKEEEPLLRGGFGIGFERFVAFLLSSSDILETITYRSLDPSGGRDE